jgi:hypothetical protein
MPDTGAPWNIPYVESADLVSDWPADSLLVANAVAAGLSAAGGLVEVKSAIFTGTQTGSVAAGGNLAITDLSITHEVADASNELIISAMLGVAGSSNNLALMGLGVYDGSAFINVGATASLRTPVSSANRHGASSADANTSLNLTFVHTPGSGSKTYTLRVINTDNNGAGRTVYINRSPSDADSISTPRGVSSLVIQEVKA